MLKDFSLDNDGVRRGAWTEEEDDKLRAYIQRYGHWSWELLPKFAGLSRSGKSCRLRWLNYLRPDIKHGNFTTEEDNTIVELHSKLGNKWTAIAAKLPGRSDNEIKNRWNSHLKKRARGKKVVLETQHVETIESNHVNLTGYPHPEPVFHKNDEMFYVGISSQQPSCSSHNEFSPSWFNDSDYALSSDFGQHNSNYELAETFWTEPFLPDITSSVNSMLSPINGVDDYIFQSSCQDMPMNDEFSWSMLDSYYDYNREYIN